MMKAPLKKVFVLSLFLLSSSFCLAQNGLQVGLRFIPQSTSFMYNTGFPLLDILKVAPYDPRWRTSQGIGFIYQPFTRWSIGADLMYSLQGGGYKERLTNVNYLKVPILLGYNASPRHKLIFNVQTGVDFAYLVDANMQYSDGSTMDIAHYVNRTNWGIPFAMGFKFKMLKSYFFNTQLYIYSDVISLAKTNDTYGVKNYILPGIRFSIDRRLTGNQ